MIGGGLPLQVVAVETEMRQLLVEVERERRTMEGKLAKLSQAFHELQHDIKPK